MAIKNIDINCLFTISSSARTVEIAGNSYTIGSSGMEGKSLYPGRSTKKKTAQYSYALLAHKYWKEGTLYVAANSDLSMIYMSYKDAYSEAAVANKSALATLSGGKWTIKIGQFASPRTQATFLSIIAAVSKNFFTTPYQFDPLLFCDAVYFGYAKENKDNFEIDDTIDPTMADQAKRAIESGSVKTLIGTTPSDFVDVFSTFPDAEVPTVETDFKEFLEGNKTINYDWDEESKKKITNLSFLENFVPTKHFYTLANKITIRLGKVIERLNEGAEGKDAIKRDFLNIRLVGNPGSGKTVLAAALSAALGLPLYTVPIQKHSEEDTFEGKNKMVEGKLSFVYTDFLKAYKNGGIVVLEEINLADPALIMGAIGQAIEPPFIVNENGFKGITRHPLCIIIATQNVGTVGSKSVNQALTSRFPHTYVINDPTEQEFVDRLMTIHPNKTTCRWVYKSYTKIKDHLCSSKVSAEDIALALTFRACAGVLDDIEEGVTRREALDKFYAIIYGESPEIAKETLAIINSLPGV